MQHGKKMAELAVTGASARRQLTRNRYKAIKWIEQDCLQVVHSNKRRTFSISSLYPIFSIYISV